VQPKVIPRDIKQLPHGLWAIRVALRKLVDDDKKAAVLRRPVNLVDAALAYVRVAGEDRIGAIVL
jgi:hypothetical protein